MDEEAEDKELDISKIMEREASTFSSAKWYHTHYFFWFGLVFWYHAVPYSLIKISGNLVQVAFIE